MRKNENEQFKRIILFFSSALLVAMQTFIFYEVWSNYYNPYMRTPLFRRGHWVLLLLYVILSVGFSYLYGAFRIGYFRTLDVVFSQVLTLILVNGITYLQISIMSLRMVNVLPILVMTLMDVFVGVAWATVMRSVYHKLYPPRKMLMIYGDHDPDGLVSKMGSRKDKYNICGFININKGEEAVKEAIREYPSVILCDLPDEARNNLLKFCFELDIRAYITPKISDVIVMGTDSIDLFDTPLLLARNSGFSFEQRFAKRVADLVISVPVFIILAPFMLLTAIAIKCYDRGPIFYYQERLTQNGEVFKIIKFRSMKVDSEGENAKLAKKGDNRVTPIGRFLRNIHFDEIPQIFNIIKGEMSWVGPRPERPEIAKQYEHAIPEFDFRLKAKAGLTGYAQIYGKYSTTPYDKLKLDLYYIEHQSLWMDIKLLLMTVKIIFKKENAEGVNPDQMTALINRVADASQYENK
ncbi:MAG: sugar transferase [Lachnospiraceae bacterium]|nr:sugar transferase [Lachnospiraceae bacterium]